MDVPRRREVQAKEFWEQRANILLKTMGWDTLKDLIILYAKKTKVSLTKKLSPEQMAELTTSEQQVISSKG